MKKVFWFLGQLFILTYPFMMYFGLTHFKPKSMALVMLIILGLQLLSSKSFGRGIPRIWTVGMAALLTVLVWVFNDSRYFLYYPCCINVMMFLLFGTSLIRPPSFIQRIVEQTTKETITPVVQAYMHSLTKVWCVFFVLNGLVALFTAMFTPLSVWVLYNGLVAYVLMGVIFFGEICFRKITKRVTRET